MSTSPDAPYEPNAVFERERWWPVHLTLPTVAGFCMWGRGEGEADRVLVSPRGILLFERPGQAPELLTLATPPLTPGQTRAITELGRLDADVLDRASARLDLAQLLRWMETDPRSWSDAQRKAVAQHLHFMHDLFDSLSYERGSKALDSGPLDALYWVLAGELSEDELPSSGLLAAEARQLIQHLEQRVHPVGSPSLHEAARRGSLAGMRRALAAGAHPDARDQDGRTALHLVTCGDEPRHLRRARLLLDAGADPNARTNAGETALEGCAAWGWSRMVALLLARGADPDGRTADGWTPLCWAAAGGHVDVVGLLLKRGAQVSPEGIGWSPLMRAAELGSAATVEVLLRAGARADERDADGRTALDLARDWAEADLLARMRAGLGLSPEAPVHVERRTSRAGEPYVELMAAFEASPTGPSMVRCEGHARVVELLKQAS